MIQSSHPMSPKSTFSDFRPHVCCTRFSSLVLFFWHFLDFLPLRRRFRHFRPRFRFFVFRFRDDFRSFSDWITSRSDLPLSCNSVWSLSWIGRETDVWCPPSPGSSFSRSSLDDGSELPKMFEPVERRDWKVKECFRTHLQLNENIL